MRKALALTLLAGLASAAACQDSGDRGCDEAAMLEFSVVGDLEGVWTDIDGDGAEFGPRLVFGADQRPVELRAIRIEQPSPLPAWEGGFDTYGCAPGDVPLELGATTKLVLSRGPDGGSLEFRLDDALVEPGHFFLEYATNSSPPNERIDVNLAADGASMTVHRRRTSNLDGGDMWTFYRAP